MKRLDRLRDEGLQHVALDRQAQSRERATRDVLPATAMPTLRARIVPRVVSTPTTRPPSRTEARDLAVLDDVDAERRSPRARSPTRRHRGAPCRRARCSSPP
jgi:hypothetical protein